MDDIEAHSKLYELNMKIGALEVIAREYKGKTIENVIQQLRARANEYDEYFKRKYGKEW